MSVNQRKHQSVNDILRAQNDVNVWKHTNRIQLFKFKSYLLFIVNHSQFNCLHTGHRHHQIFNQPPSPSIPEFNYNTYMQWLLIHCIRAWCPSYRCSHYGVVIFLCWWKFESSHTTISEIISKTITKNIFMQKYINMKNARTNEPKFSLNHSHAKHISRTLITKNIANDGKENPPITKWN